MSVSLFIEPHTSISLSGSVLIIPLYKLLLRYKGIQTVDISLTGDYKTDRELIFGKGGFIKDTPLVKAIMMITGYVQAKAYVKPDETFEDKIVSIYSITKPRTYGRYFFIEVLSALMARVTNYFQAIQGVYDEDPEEIKADINAIIDELIYRLKDPKYNITFKVYLYDSPPSYEVLVEIFEKTSA